jgi:uncharacterized protein (TIGR01777 family)
MLARHSGRVEAAIMANDSEREPGAGPGDASSGVTGAKRPAPMRIAITGSSGFVGAALVQSLRADGHDVVQLQRRSGGGAGTAPWDPASGEVDSAALGRIDAVVHLAGENVAGGRWTAARKRAIADSRGPATLALCSTLASLPQPPAIMVSASATGIYGDRGDDPLDETSAAGSGFLADVARAWEAGTEPLRARGTRVVNLRIGMVLDPSGGALQRMLLPFRLGVGGRLGHGRQGVSWITRDDLVAAIRFALQRSDLSGPVAAVSPNPVTNREFTAALGHALRRPTILPAPAFALRLVFGEMASALLLSSQRVQPRRLLAAGFTFGQPTLAQALAPLQRR